MSVIERDMPAVESAARSYSRAAIGLRNPHLAEIGEARSKLTWLEIHSENYLLAPTTPRYQALERVRHDFALSCHGVGLSICSAEGLDRQHLRDLRMLYDRLQPFQVSEHLAWSVIDGRYYNDLLPIPYTDETLDIVCRNIDQAQEALGRRLLIENPSRYIDLPNNDWPEPVFLGEMAKRTGCGLLFDVNNLFISAHNLSFETADYLRDLPVAAIGQFHVAGHSCRELTAADGTVDELLIDDHGSTVPEGVWQLLDEMLTLTGTLPVLVEWDNQVPALDVLLAEAKHAQQRLDAVAGKAGDHAA
ncbi:MAG TPA: DUF692 domain-containing protein [Terriglobales bacterium]|nr:DUF692 domain-containing protein [Terriglobales bacterium]